MKTGMSLLHTRVVIQSWFNQWKLPQKQFPPPPISLSALSLSLSPSPLSLWVTCTSSLLQLLHPRKSIFRVETGVPLFWTLWCWFLPGLLPVLVYLLRPWGYSVTGYALHACVRLALWTDKFCVEVFNASCTNFHSLIYASYIYDALCKFRF